MSTLRPRVLHLISTLDRAGAQVVVVGLAATLVGYHSTIAYLWGGTGALEDAGRGGSAADFSRHGRPDPLVLPRLLRWARGQQFDMIHTHLVHAGVVGKMVARFLSVPVVTTRHYAANRKEGSAIYRIEDRMSRSAERIIAVSGAVRERLLEAGHAPERIVVIPNGIDLDWVDRAVAGGSAIAVGAGPAGPGRPGSGGPGSTLSGHRPGSGEVHPASRRPRLGSVGRLDHGKGFDLVIDAVARLRDRGVDVDLELVGEGPNEGALRAQAGRLGLSDRVSLTGALPRAEALSRMKSWDLFVLASRTEAFGIVLLEAMALGTPVLATRIGGIAEVLGEAGRLVSPESADALAEGIEMALGERADSAGRSRRARKRVEEMFSLRQTAEAYARVYDQILGRRPRDPDADAVAD